MDKDEAPERDYVDQLLEQWTRERRDLDFSAMGIIARIARAAHLYDRELETVFSTFHLHRGRFDVLAALRRAGPPYLLSPTALYNSLLISSGAMTHRLDRLEKAALIDRIPDPHDGRGLLVRLTKKGFETIDQAVASHTRNELSLLKVLTEDEKRNLEGALRKVLLSFGDRPHAADSSPLGESVVEG